MSAPAAPSGWTWKKTIMYGIMGAGSIALVRLAMFGLFTLAAGPDTYSDESSIELDSEYMQAIGYEVQLDKAKLTYQASATDGRFTLYVIPESAEDAFYSGKTFQYFEAQAAQNVEAAGGSIVLPRGTHYLAFICESVETCKIDLALTLSPTRVPVQDELVSTQHLSSAPTAIWDHEPFELDPWSYLSEPEFFTRGPGALDIDVSSDGPLEVCLLEQAQFELWLAEEPFNAITCEEDASRMRNSLEIGEGEYALLVMCVSEIEPCSGTLHVAFRPDGKAAPITPRPFGQEPA